MERAKLVTYILAAAAILTLAWAIWDLTTRPIDPRWFELLLLVLITVPFAAGLAYSIPYMGLTYLMAIGMLFGPAPCVIAASCYSILTARMSRLTLLAAASLTSVMVIQALIYSLAFRFVMGESATFRKMILGTVLVAAISHLFSSLLIPKHLRNRLGLNSLVCAIGAVIIAWQFNIHPLFPLAVAPLIGIVYLWTRLQTRPKTEEVFQPVSKAT